MFKLKRFVFFIILFVVSLALVFVFAGNKEERNTDKVGLYFYTSNGAGIEAVETEIVSENKKDLYYKVAEALIKGPSNSKNLPIMQKDVKVNSINIDAGNLSIDFSDEFGRENITSVYAVVKTYTKLLGVNSVKVTISGRDILKANGEPLGFISGDEINMESDDDFSTRVVLYFANEDGTALVKEVRKITIADSQPREEYILAELIKGPKADKNNTVFPRSVDVLSVETTDGICYVNFKKNFLGKSKDSVNQDMMTVYAIVNSLTELEGVNGVQFLIEGKKPEMLGEYIKNILFVRNEGIIEK